MASRLRKLVLINAKTSGKNCSGRISEIDPRNGAAITGPNGVGKTTTLQLLPLFFGFSPNQIAPVGENRESMLRFVLPNPECALAFEYQRGDEDTDIFTVVMRRASSLEAAEYRFFDGAFNKDLFVAKEGDSEVFVDDQGFVDACNKLGIQYSAKHTSAQYRNVILNTIGVGKDAESRRNEARKYSFSRKRLPYLDRLVAAVVKEKINFSDFTDVAATIVTDRMGGVTTSGNGKFPALRQSKEQIEKWLKDRDGAERALKLTPLMDSMRATLRSNQEQEIVLGNKRSDVRHLRRINERICASDKEQLQAIEGRRNQKKSEFNEQKGVVERSLERAKEDEKEVERIFRALKNRKSELEEKDAKGWAEKEEGLFGLELQSKNLSELIHSMQEQAQGIAQAYDIQIAQINEETAMSAGKLKDGKGHITQRYDAEITLLEQQEGEAVAAINEEFSEKLNTCQASVDGLADELTLAKHKKDHPVIAQEIEDGVVAARSAWHEHQNERFQEQEKLSVKFSALQKITGEWRVVEQQILLQKETLQKAISALENAKVRCKPPEGSLHGALLESKHAAWRDSLARVIDPKLLSRTDLQPHFVEEGALLFGWGLNLDAIESPDWIQNDILENELEQCKVAEERARARLAELESNFKKIEGDRKEAQDAHTLQESQFNVIKARSAGIEAEWKGREDGLIAARNTAKTLAGQQFNIVLNKLNEAKSQLKQIQSEWSTAIKLENETFSDAREQAKSRRDAEYLGVDKEVMEIQMRGKQQVQDREIERDHALANKGVDTVKLGKLRKELVDLQGTIQNIKAHHDLAVDWKDWVQTQGQTQYVDAEVKLSRAKSAIEELQSHLDALDKEFRNTMRTLEQEEGKRTQSFNRASNEIEILNGLDGLLDGFAVSGTSLLTEDTFASELKGSCGVELSKHAEIKRKIRTEMQRVERELCEIGCSTKSFVDGVLREGAADESDVARAEKLVRIYDRIPQEVVVHVNTSLTTILDNIREYRKKVQTFESEVKRFNKELQDGLKSVSQNFKRFSDFTGSVVCDFDRIDFIGKLKLLDDVVQDHKGLHHAAYSSSVPEAGTAEALRTFMGALGSGSMELNLGQHITLSGSVTDDGVFKTFHSETQLEQISSNGLTAIALTSLLCGLLNVIRGAEKIYIPWATDEVGRFDPENFVKLIEMLSQNHIDAVTASPALTPAAYRQFAKNYAFRPHGEIAEYKGRNRGVAPKTFIGVTA